MKQALIVTYYAGANYGAFWQAYGIGKYIEKCGFNVNYLRHNEMQEELSSGKNEYERTKNKAILEEINKSFDLTDDLKTKYDLVILGSDEIWNRTSAIKREYRQYWGQGIKATNKISYAPCAINTSWKRLIFKIPALKNLDGISVRDIQTSNTIKKIIGKEVPIVLDPTFLISYEFVNKPLIEGEYLLIYSYGLIDKQIKVVKNYAKEKKLKIVVSGHNADWADYNPACSPKEWLSLFKYSNLVFTTTFHGTVFSIIFEKNFLLLGNNVKAVSLLDEFDLTDHICNDCEQISEKIVNNIDYNILNGMKTKMLGDSLYYLNSFSLNYGDNGIPKLTFNKDECCGCTACYSICPKGAIIMSSDEEGFLYPMINADRCIKCHKCLNVCSFKVEQGRIFKR